MEHDGLEQGEAHKVSGTQHRCGTSLPKPGIIGGAGCSSVDSAGITIPTSEVSGHEQGGRHRGLCGQEEAPGVYFPLLCHLERSRCYQRWPSAASHLVLQVKPSFSHTANLSRSRCRASLKAWKVNSLCWESPTHLRSYPHGCPASLCVLGGAPAERSGGAGSHGGDSRAHGGSGSTGRGC